MNRIGKPFIFHLSSFISLAEIKWQENVKSPLKFFFWKNQIFLLKIKKVHKKLRKKKNKNKVGGGEREKGENSRK